MPPSFEATGTIKRIMDAKTFLSGFTKREFVLLTEDDYPQTVPFECGKERCSLLDKVAVKDRVRVAFRLRGREWQERFFVNLEAFSITKIDEAQLSSGPDEPALAVSAPSEPTNGSLLDDDPPF